jgi:sugar phosphate isomerase/epimerase
MYKNLNPASLGVSGRQSELIELALTYGFRGLDLEAGEIVKRAVQLGVEEAARYIRSGRVKVGGWTQPVDASASADAFAKQLDRLPVLAAAAKQMGLTYCTIDIQPVSGDLPYHENFERHRERLNSAAEVLQQHGIRLGLRLKASAGHRQDGVYQFIHQAEELLTLIRTIASDNVGLALDTWSWKVGGGGSDQLAELTGQQIVSVAIADVPLDTEFRTIAETQRLLPDEDSIPEYGALLRSLSQRKYSGPVTLRPHPSQLAKLSRDASVDKCAKILEQIWIAAGLSKAPKLAPAPTPAPAPAPTPALAPDAVTSD